MALIETDMILALASSTDKHHNEAVKIIREIRPLRLSPYALIELDLLVLSGKFEVRVPDFYENLSETLQYYNLEIIKPNPRHLARGQELRRKYNLTYFDSLHASTAIVENEILISYDKIYSNVKELKYLTPRDALIKRL